jgi:hypothetical protein
MRTAGLHYSTQTSHWLGILPNFFGALGICLALYSTHLLKLKRIRLSKNQLFVASFTIPIIGLTAWEFLQILAKRPFDINDIYMTLAGSIIGGLIILSSEITKGKRTETEYVAFIKQKTLRDFEGFFVLFKLLKNLKLSQVRFQNLTLRRLTQSAQSLFFNLTNAFAG